MISEIKSVSLSSEKLQKPGIQVHYSKGNQLAFAAPDGLSSETILNLSAEGRLKLQNQLRQVMQEDPNRFRTMQEAYHLEQEVAPDAENQPLAEEPESAVEKGTAADQNRERLNQVKNRFDEIISNRTGENDRKTIEEMQRAQADLRRMKQFEQETRQQAEREAREARAQSAKNQAEADRDKADLFVMLESFEEYEKREREAEGTEEKEASGAARGTQSGEPKTVGDVLTGSAVQMKNSGMNREDKKNRSIDFIDNKGLYMLDKAQEEYECFMDEYEQISRVLDEEDLSEEEQEALVSAYVKKAEGDRFHPGGYGEVDLNRKRGLAQRQNARDVRREALGVDVMPSVQKSAGILADAAGESVLDGQTQQYVARESEEIDRRLQEKLDDRNDVTKEPEEVLAERAETKEEQAEEQEEQEENS